MGATTAIEWTDASWNPIRARRDGVLDGKGKPLSGWHCTHASEGCRNCYAEMMNKRLGTKLPYKPGHLGHEVELFLDEKLLLDPLRWARRRGRKIFVCSMTDLFADFVPDEWIDRVFAVMALCPEHVFQLLTKRPARMRAYVARFEQRPEAFGKALAHVARAAGLDKQAGLDAIDDMLWPLPNVWKGVSVEDQRAADERIPDLLATPAAVRWLSCEPLLGPLDLGRWIDSLDWVVAGGESGPDARLMLLPHVQSLRDQSAAVGVAFLMKQWGEWIPAGQTAAAKAPIKEFGYDHDAQHRYHRIGKKAAGRLLDGVLHDAFPATSIEQVAA